MLGRSSSDHVAHRLRACLVALTAAVALVAAPVAAQASAPAQAQRRFTVATYNLYLGANLTPLFGVPPGPGLVAAAGQVYAHVVQTNFPARAEAVADLIAEEQPVIVGLQEVALWRTAPASNPAAWTTTFDFLALTLQALHERGLHYVAVATNFNFGGALPISATTLASFTDRDVIIVRADLPASEVKWWNAISHTFQASMPVPLGGGTIQVPRGWSSVDVKFRGKSYRFANTHLEAFSDVVRNFQAQELAGALSVSPLPIVLVGDMNSRPDDGTGAYGILAGAGFVDAWSEAMGSAAGNTSGQTDDLDNVPSTIDHRIDLILHNSDGYLDAITGSGEVIGEEIGDRTATDPPLWPSDHAGVAMTLAIAFP